MMMKEIQTKIKELDKELTVSLISEATTFQSIQPEWQDLNKKSLKGNIFTSWEWLYTWWEIYQEDGKRQLFILTCRDKELNLVGLAPFQIINNQKKYFPFGKQLVMLGTGETDGSGVFGEYMDLLIAPDYAKRYAERVTQLFSEYIYKNRKLWNGMKFHQTLVDSHVSTLFVSYEKEIISTKKAEGFRTIIELPETYNAYLMSLRKKMRNNITRVFSRLENEQDYTIEAVNDIDALDDAIVLLAELNRSRRSDMALSSSFDQTSFENYHRKLIRRLFLLNDPDTHFSLRIMRFSNEPVAMLYSFIDGDTIHAYQSGFKKDYGQRYSLLTTMLTQEISKSIDNKKIKYFNFMYDEKESTYKRRYSGDVEKVYNISYERNNPRGRFYLFLHGPVKDIVKKYLLKLKS